MITTTNRLQIARDLPAKKLNVIRHFDAPVELVWRAWTESELLDQWWAPKPYRAETKTMEFRPGGHWLYAMVGPDNSKMWCKFDYTAITPQKSFDGFDMFCDEKGNKNPEFDSMNWHNEFLSTADGTKVLVNISFPSEEVMNKIIEMGIEEGFTAALTNLDELLANEKVHG
jgi:uncharacterized protein YndB with AHSA1/START domain